MKTARTLAASAVGASILLSGVAMASPAQAASTTKCHTTTKTFDLPSKPDVKMMATLCAKYTGKSGSYRTYKTWLHKVSWDASWWNPGTRFNDLWFETRAEHGHDHRSSGQANDIRTAVNNKASGSKTFSSGPSGYGVTYVKTKKKNWTADGYAVFDANDGKGLRTWQLHGTAPVR
ncbi:hypothetical protein [Streptomyces sp. NPDC093589]|uniref:hypothetical protein n=1 Tax=Streptomyces sp. NPDC093589 TaxID=3366043 RepID=UPI0037F35C2D